MDYDIRIGNSRMAGKLDNIWDDEMAKLVVRWVERRLVEKVDPTPDQGAEE